MTEKFDVVIVGAGPAGISAAITTARAKLNTLVIERGNIPGEKNMFGGIIFRHAFEKLIPDFVKLAPLERKVIEYQYWFLTNDACIKLIYRDNNFKDKPSGYTALRAKFDSWYAKKAEEAGAMIITRTTALQPIIKDGQVIGVETDRGEVYANVVIAADGVNSLMAKHAGLYRRRKPNQVALGVKEVLEVQRTKIEEIFQLGMDEGIACLIFGGPLKGMTGGGFLYTNRDSISLGFGALLEDIANKGKRPNKILEEFKKHPSIYPYIKESILKEYSAHLIPEGGYDAIPQLYTNGMLVAGDAAMFVNVLEFRGTDYAVESGICAGKTAIYAHKVKDFSANTLKYYRKLLENSFVLRDLKKFRRIPHIIEKNKALFDTYPEILRDILRIWNTVDGELGAVKIKKIQRAIFSKRNPLMLIKDVVELIRGVIF
jgi:electron transfer flavoprotein-quinone oxidoreductase